MLIQPEDEQQAEMTPEERYSTQRRTAIETP